MLDSHCHIAGPEFVDDLPAVVGRARSAGLAHALVILAADDDDEIGRAAIVSSAWEAVRLAIGVHPHAAARFGSDPAASARLVDDRMSAQPLTRALGEIGLDYHYDHAPRDVQQAVFREQLRLARRRRLPVVIHTREAEDDTCRLLDEEHAGEAGGVLHCFTGTREMARRALDLGFYISIAGIVTFPRASDLKAIATFVPLDRLLIETDSPFLAPVPFRGQRNEPAHVTLVAQSIAQLRGCSTEAIGDAAVQNFERLFSP